MRRSYVLGMRTALLLLLVACSTPPKTAPTFAWATPAGWRSETIPFPLEFAPALPYRGTEELRFAPGFFKPGSPTYFTYSFVWLVDGAPSFDAPRLSGELGTYFAGLAHAVDGARFDASAHHALLTRAGDALDGTVDTVDAFGDGHALHLRVNGEVVHCDGGRTGLVLSLSPRTDADTWAMLAEQRRTLRCA